jgi:hypothetical protein
VRTREREQLDVFGELAALGPDPREGARTAGLGMKTPAAFAASQAKGPK